MSLVISTYKLAVLQIIETNFQKEDIISVVSVLFLWLAVIHYSLWFNELDLYLGAKIGSSSRGFIMANRLFLSSDS